MSVFAGLIGLLGLLFILAAVLGVVAPSIFKNKKTGKVPKRIHVLIGGVVAAGIAFVVGAAIAPETETSKNLPEEKPHVAKIEDPEKRTLQNVPAPASVSNNDSENRQTSLQLPEARAFANVSLKVLNQAEQSLEDGIRLNDRLGITRYVRKPLQAELDRWPLPLERNADDQREHFAYCQDAMLRLLSMANGSSSQAQTVEQLEYLRQDKAKYNKSKGKCEQALKTTDEGIKASIDSEQAEMKKTLGGGRECLTVFGMDKKTGEVVAMPKPAHCKPTL